MVAQLSADLLVMGYRSSSSPLAIPPGYCTTGSRNGLFLGTGKHQAYKGPTIINSVNGGRVMFTSPDAGYVSLGDATNAGNGSIIGIISKAMAFIGGGPLYINGLTRSVSASTALQLLLYRSGGWSTTDTGPYLAGLDPPTAPGLSESIIASTVMSGTYSVAVWAIRSTTGARSRRSPASSPVVIDGKKARIEFPPIDTSRAADRWGVGVTQAGFGQSGPYYELQEIAESTIARTNNTAAITTGTKNLSVTTPGYFTADDVGKYILIVGGGGPGTYLRTIIDTFTDATHVVLHDAVTATLSGGQILFRSYDFEWGSGDLFGKDLAPILDYPPPAAVYASAIEDAMAVIGCYGDSTSGVSATTPGSAINVSLPLFPESFPADSLLFLPEPPVGVISRASDNFAFIGCKHSVHALTYTGGDPPMSLQSVWANTGVPSQTAMCIAEGGRLYVYTNSKRGPARIAAGNEPDFEFAKGVVDDMASWTPANVVVGYDDDHKLVCYMHQKLIYAFNVLSDEQWCAPLDLTGLVTGNICACVTINGAMLIATNDGSTVRLYNFNAGTGTVVEVYFPNHSSQVYADIITQINIAMRADSTNSVTMKVYKNGDSTASVTKTITPTRTGFQHLPTQRIDVRGAKSHQVYLSFTASGGDMGFDIVQAMGESSMVTV